MNNIEYNQYEKITDVVCYIGSKFVLKFNVQLGNKDTTSNKKRAMHNEYKYNSNKYNDIRQLITVKRNFDYFLSIESVDKNEREYIMIYPKDMLFFKFALDEAFSWFTDSKYKGIYNYNENNELVISRHIEPATVDGLCMNKKIYIEPSICKYQDGSQHPGVRFIMTNTSMDVSINSLSALLYTISNFNMYLSAQNMLNYLQRPVDYGYNLYEFNNNSYEEPIIENSDGYVETTSKGREIQSKKRQKSFFSKVDGI